MKLYFVSVEMYDYGSTLLDTSCYSNVYSSFEQAKEEGLRDLQKRIKDVEEAENISFIKMLEEEKMDYSFTITRD